MQRAIGSNYLVEAAYVGSRGRQMVLKVDINQAPPVVGVSDANVNRPFITLVPGMRSMSQVAVDRQGGPQRDAAQVPASLCEQLLVPEQLYVRQAYDYASDNEAGISNTYDLGYNWGHADYDVRHTFSSSWIYELPWARGPVYGGWQLNGILYLRSGLPFTVAQNQNVRSTGTANRPNQTCDGQLSSPTVEMWFDLSCFSAPADTTGTFGDAKRNSMRGPGQFNIDASFIKNTRIGRFTTEFRVEAFNVLNHPQFGQPTNNINSGTAGQITAMLSSAVLRTLRNDRAAGAARGEGPVLGSERGLPIRRWRVAPH